MIRTTMTAVAGLSLMLAACQPAAETDAAAPEAPTAPSADELTSAVAALVEADESCNQQFQGERAYQTLDLGGGATAVLADCTVVNDVMWHALFVQGADGALMRQPLVAYSGGEGDWMWEPTSILPLNWDATTRELSSTMESPEDEAGTVVLSDRIRWRWNGDSWAMVETTRARTGATDAAAPTVTWPTTPATEDPTPAMTPTA